MFIYHFNRMIRNRVLWLIFAIVVGATFLALPSCFTGDSSGNEYAGTLGKKKISESEYAAAATFVSLSSRADDLSPAVTETQIWAHIAAIHTAAQMGLTVSPAELRSVIHSEPAFQIDGQFNEERYRSIIMQYFSNLPGRFNRYNSDKFVDEVVVNYERLRSDEIILGKLMSAVGAASVASPMEVDDEISARTDKITFQYATVSNAFATAEIELTDDDLLSYYEEHKDDYTLPNRVGVRFARLSATNFLNAVAVDEADIDYYYDSHKEEPLYSRQGTNGVESIPLEEVHDSIYRELAMKEAIYIAMTNRNDFVTLLAATNLETVLKFLPLDSGLFAIDAPSIQDVEREALQDFRETAHTLDASQNDDSRFGVASGKEFVYTMCAITNDLHHVQPFDEVKDAIRPLALAAMRQKKFLALAEEKAAALKASLTNETSFADAAAAQSLGVSTSITFSVESLSPTPFENARSLIPEVVHLKVGTVSKPIEVYNAALLAFVSDRKAGDDFIAGEQRNQIGAMLSASTAGSAFADWLIWNLERTGFTSKRAASFDATEPAPEAAPDIE